MSLRIGSISPWLRRVGDNDKVDGGGDDDEVDVGDDVGDEDDNDDKDAQYDWE